MKINTIKILGLSLICSAALSSCSDSFLEDKKNYDNVNPDIYNYYEGAIGRLSDVYGWCLPHSNADANWKFPSTGRADQQAKCTEEYYGLGAFVHPENILESMNNNIVPDYIIGDPGNIQASVYGRIRNINEVISGISGSTLPEAQKNELLGQVYFFRAWCYYLMFKWYGGVPIVTEVMEPVETAFTERATAKETYDFILDDLNNSAKMLEATTGNGGWDSSNWGRVTNATALALKGRVMLLWASPLFNRAGDDSRWQNAYNEMKADIQKIQAAGHSLYQGNGQNVNGSVFANMFTDAAIKNPEYVFLTVRSNVKTDAEEPYNDWEGMIRPKNAAGNGSLIPSKTIIDLFPMADGKRPAGLETYTKLSPSSNAYNEMCPFMNRDPRFYRTFVFPGFRWAYAGDPTVKNSDNPSYDNGSNYELWSYVWYTSETAAGDAESGDKYGADNLLKDGAKSVYLRKRSDDADVNSPLYSWDSENTWSPFRWSGQPYVEIRYAEVLLNLAEAACMAGNTDEALGYLKQIRQRAGYAAGAEGLDDVTGKEATMSAILYERQIELAYEGKRFDDMRRWLLFDGGVNFAKVNGAPNSWALTGFGGNTCAWLGVKPLNGTWRETIEYHTKNIGGTTKDSDPLVKADVQRPAAVDLRKTGEELNTQLTDLVQWYNDNLVQKVNSGDGRSADKTAYTIQFRPEYYLLGFPKSALDRGKHLGQTIGWADSNNSGANGTFDPLAE